MKTFTEWLESKNEAFVVGPSCGGPDFQVWGAKPKGCKNKDPKIPLITGEKEKKKN